MRKKNKPLLHIQLKGDEKICIHAPLHLGDSVLSIPLVQNLKELHPRSKITLVVKKELADLWKRQSHRNRLRICDSTVKSLEMLTQWLKKERFDLSFILATGEDVAQAYYQAGIPIRIGYDFWGRGHFLSHCIKTDGTPTDPKLTRKHLVQNYLDLLKIASIKPRFLRPTLPDVNKKNRIQRKSMIGIAPGASFGPAKRWPAESFRELAFKIPGTLKKKIVLLGSANDRISLKPLTSQLRSKRILNQIGKTNLNELMKWISKCSLIIANDSGISHLSNALGVPTVTLFGSSSPTWTRPLDPRSKVVTLSLPCSPCFQSACPLMHTQCLRNLSVNLVFDNVLKIL